MLYEVITQTVGEHRARLLDGHDGGAEVVRQHGKDIETRRGHIGHFESADSPADYSPIDRRVAGLHDRQNTVGRPEANPLVFGRAAPALVAQQDRAIAS